MWRPSHFAPGGVLGLFEFRLPTHLRRCPDESATHHSIRQRTPNRLARARPVGKACFLGKIGSNPCAKPLCRGRNRGIPYGVYDIGANAGCVSDGVDHDTATLPSAIWRP
jgi:hypothetical protein